MSDRRHNRGYVSAHHHHKNAKRKESNLSKFRRECRERDIRKMQKIANRLKKSNDNHFSSTISQLKSDAQIISDRFQNLKRKAHATNKENRRHSMGFTCNYAEKENIEPTAPPPPQPSAVNEMPQNIIKRGNAQIFFEHKNYYSSLHNKYDMNAQKSNMHSVYNYLHSLRNDETTLKNKLRRKWQELKKDVDKTFHSFNHRKAKKESTELDPLINKRVNITVTPGADIVIAREHESQPLIQLAKEDSIDDKTSIKMMIDQKDPEPPVIDAITTEIPEQKEENTKLEMTTEPVLNDEENEDPNHSSIYSVSHLQKPNEYWDFSVRQLKDKLLNMNVSIDQCIEKRDLIQKLKLCRLDNVQNVQNGSQPNKNPNSKRGRPKQRKQSVQNQVPRSALNKNKPTILFDTILFDTRESKQQIMNRADAWIHRWSYRRSFRQILNSVLD